MGLKKNKKVGGEGGGRGVGKVPKKCHVLLEWPLTLHFQVYSTKECLCL